MAPKNELLAEAGRRGARWRWGRASQAQKDASAANARAGMRRLYIERAIATFERLGVTATPDQIDEAATRLHRQDLRERLAVARDKAIEAKAVAKAERDQTFAEELAATYAVRIEEADPTIGQSAAMKFCMIEARTELNAPDGFVAKRLAKRLDLMLAAARANAEGAA